ncbi:MAG: hypothetical protein JW941_03185 [Candidatus Coatesbacteria bacterium]|nr:hypothetical protein [Candidatus Coatesbacteria bacterium]
MTSLIMVKTDDSPDVLAHIEAFEKMRLGTTKLRDWRLRGDSLTCGVLAALSRFEAPVWRTTRFREFFIKAGKLQT